MRILGVGCDIVSVARIRRSLEGLGRPFAARVLGPIGQMRTADTVDARRLSCIFAAKEACAKALGTGFSDGIGWEDIDILLPGTATLHGPAERRALFLLRDHEAVRISLSCGVRGSTASAVCIICADTDG